MSGTSNTPETEPLAALALHDLKDRWETAFGKPPPAGISRKLMMRALTHDLQSRRFGALKPKTRRKLMKALAPRASPLAKSRGTLPTGTRLLREWNGVTHRVDVTEDGFCWNDRIWSSLSAIAREITGTRWNGPLFFGLRNRKVQAA